MIKKQSRTFVCVVTAALVFVSIPGIKIGKYSVPRLDSTTGIGQDVHAGNYIKAGRCTESFISWAPGWVQDLADAWGEISPQQKLAHDDVLLEEYRPPERDPEVRTIRGFFATLDDTAMWIFSMTMYFLEKVVVYVDSEMRDSGSNNFCTIEIEGYPAIYGEGLPGPSIFTPSVSDTILLITERINVSWAPQYHLFEKNCQHWAHWVMTGEDNSR